jgi:HlyD family secretion protein
MRAEKRVKRKWKIILGILAVLVVAGGTYASIRFSQRDLVTVQTGKVTQADLAAQVTASGEIKPKNYINLGANAQGRIVELLVKEGDRVRQGQVVARIESVQANADVRAQQANVATNEADSAAQEIGMRVQDDTILVQQATIERTKTEIERAKINLDRVTQLWNEKLVARQEYDQRRVDYDAQMAALREGEARLVQMQAQKAQNLAQVSVSQKRIVQAQASLARFNDILAKHDVVAPIDGMVTNLPVRIGETVVMGVQNSAASSVLTIADMSLITAELKVDETDIVTLTVGQIADITIDAMPNQTFRGKVIEIGNTALSRSTGQVASASAASSNEAKDFKVVVALENPPEEVRPGLSCSAKITTATRQDVTIIPIQALTVRQKGDLEDDGKQKNKAANQGPLDVAAERARREEIQGVFVVNGDKAEFRMVETGITGTTDIEVTGGLEPGDQIVIGGYRAIRTMRNGARIKIDNRALVDDTKS